MDINLTGKRAFVTGAGRGIGREVVRVLIATGASVVGADLIESNLQSLKLEFPTVETVQIDLSDWSATKRALTPYAERIDLLVNNAGYAETLPLESITEGSLDRHWDINVKALVNVTQTLVPGMKQRKSGSIVNVSSVAGLFALADHLAYGASKAAVDLITKVLALELGPYNVRVNSVNPTVVWTDLAKVVWADKDKRERMESKIPLGRFGKPEEVAQTIVFLLSDRAGMLNGVLLPIDGGLTSTSCPA